jgi:toxin ParE1/3/4
VSRAAAPKLELTQRALRDIQEIYDYSVERFGMRTAEKYLSEIEEALLRIKSRPSLLRPEGDFHKSLRFYRVNKHLLIADVLGDSIVVLTLLHTSMDLPARLAELQPTLAAEVEMLHKRLRAGRPKDA